MDKNIKTSDKDINKIKEVDIYRDTLLRYCGYSNEIGESFRPIIPKLFVHLSYAIAISYVLAECSHKSYKIFKRPENIGGGLKAASTMAGDVFLWQMLASVIIPGFTINRVTWTTGKCLKMAKIKGITGKWLPTCIGLLTIPFIIHPIDYGVDVIMDKTYRNYVQ